MLPNIIHFLQQLEKNNNREWFNDNKAEYQRVHGYFLEYAEALKSFLSIWYPSLEQQTIKNCVYRIYNDMRFHNKLPYKIHFAAKYHPAELYSGFYMHIGTKEHHIGGGAYHPSKEALAMIRNKIKQHPTTWEKMITQPDFTKYFSLWGRQLKKPPRHYSDSDPMIEYIKYQDFIAMHHCHHQQVTQNNYMNYVRDCFKAIKPFCDFLAKE